MGALVSTAQRDDVRARIAELDAAGARIVAGDPDADPGPAGGAFLQPVLLRADDPWSNDAVHDVEPFGPVSTIMPYRDLADAIALANRGMGSLALSLFTHAPATARDFVLGAAAYHGRMLVIDRNNAAESTGHGSPLPVLIHGGPGRAGGGEEMGGVRGVKHYMQRTAIQSSPAMIAAITGALHRRRAQAQDRRPPVPQAHERARHRRHAEDRQPHGHHRRHRAFRRLHRRQILRPHGRGSGQGVARSSRAASRTAI